jgi:RNA polymerase sigma-70 factor (ECF subfamily)
MLEIIHDLSEVETLDDVLAETEPVTPLPTPAVEQGAISDEALMEAIAHGNSAALSTLYDRYASILKALTIRVVHDEAEADDLLQEVFMQVWQQARNYSSDKGKPLGWIVTLTRRRAIDRLRKRQAYCRAKDRFEVTTDRQPESWVHNRIEDDIHLEDMRTFLKAKIEGLPPFQREAIEMAFFKGMSQREIALATETPLGTIKTRLELGLRKLSESVRGIRHKI